MAICLAFVGFCTQEATGDEGGRYPGYYIEPIEIPELSEDCVNLPTTDWKIDRHTADFVETYAIRSSDSPSCVSVTSRGGLVSDVIKVSSLLNEQDITLVVDGICASSCVSLTILVDRVVFSETSVILVHATFMARHNTISSLFPEYIPTLTYVRQAVKQELDQVERILDSKNFIQYLVDSITGLQPYCANIPNRNSLKPYGVDQISSRYTWFVPDKQLIALWRGEEGMLYVVNSKHLQDIVSKLNSIGQRTVVYKSVDDFNSQKVDATILRPC